MVNFKIIKMKIMMYWGRFNNFFSYIIFLILIVKVEIFEYKILINNIKV
jgi:hypothetical protein